MVCVCGGVSEGHCNPAEDEEASTEGGCFGESRISCQGVVVESPTKHPHTGGDNGPGLRETKRNNSKLAYFPPRQRSTCSLSGMGGGEHP